VDRSPGPSISGRSDLDRHRAVGVGRLEAGHDLSSDGPLQQLLDALHEVLFVG
jgi:hypothetical protein